MFDPVVGRLRLICVAMLGSALGLQAQQPAGSSGAAAGTAAADSISATASVAPDSIAGKVYRDSYLYRGLLGESTIVFKDGGRFISLIDRFVNSGHIDYNMRLLPPRPDGTYRYARTSAHDATVELDYDDGTKASMALYFTSGTTGFLSSSIERSFTFSDLGVWKAAAAHNLSTRGTVSPGHPMVVGLIVPAATEVLIRAVGPSLRSLGVTTVWSDPDFQLYSGDKPYGTFEKHNADWDAPDVDFTPDSPLPVTQSAGPGLQKVFSYVAAFPLQANSKDAADVTRLSPGTYTIVCAPSPGDPGGDALVEVYFLP